MDVRPPSPLAAGAIRSREHQVARFLAWGFTARQAIQAETGCRQDMASMVIRPRCSTKECASRRIDLPVGPSQGAPRPQEFRGTRWRETRFLASSEKQVAQRDCAGSTAPRSEAGLEAEDA
jgi:hypothetical protein